MKIKKTCITITVIFYLALFFYANCCLSYSVNHSYKPNTELSAIDCKSFPNTINKIFISKSPINLREGNKRENKKRDSFLFRYTTTSSNIRESSCGIKNYISDETDNAYNEMLYSYFVERLIE